MSVEILEERMVILTRGSAPPTSLEKVAVQLACLMLPAPDSTKLQAQWETPSQGLSMVLALLLGTREELFHRRILHLDLDNILLLKRTSVPTAPRLL